MQDTQLNSDRLTVILRKSLQSLFQDKLRKEMEDLDCHYFVHNLIKNYDRPGHTVSSFHTNLEWQQEYWREHWDRDLLSRKINHIAETDGFAISSWDFIDPESDVMKRRKSVCYLDDGVHFTFRYDDGLLENYSFGWKNTEGKKMSFERLLKLSDLVSDFQEAHLKLFSESTPDLSGGK